MATTKNDTKWLHLRGTVGIRHTDGVTNYGPGTVEVPTADADRLLVNGAREATADETKAAKQAQKDRETAAKARG